MKFSIPIKEVENFLTTLKQMSIPVWFTSAHKTPDITDCFIRTTDIPEDCRLVLLLKYGNYHKGVW